MAKVKSPLLSIEARGGLGGLVFNTWRGRNYVKTNTSPTGQGTPKRLIAQALMATTSRLWKGISEALRAGWNQYAIDHPVSDWSGSPGHNTGFNWYMACNIRLQLLGLPVVNTVPTVSAPAAPTGLTLSYGTTALWMASTSAAYSTNSFIVKGVGPHSAGRIAKREHAILIGHYSLSTARPISCYASPTAGRYTIFATIADHANGLESTEQSAYADVT
jgi:hypothetical protein